MENDTSVNLLQNTYFTDINNIFYSDSDIITDSSVKAINNSISNIIFTNKGDKVGDPEFGSDIKKLLFSPMDLITEHLLKEEIYDSIRKYEPRIKIEKITVKADHDENIYRIQMIYRIIKSPDIQNTYVSVLKRI